MGCGDLGDLRRSPFRASRLPDWLAYPSAWLIYGIAVAFVAACIGLGVANAGAVGVPLAAVLGLLGAGVFLVAGPAAGGVAFVLALVAVHLVTGGG